MWEINEAFSAVVLANMKVLCICVFDRNMQIVEDGPVTQACVSCTCFNRDWFLFSFKQR